MFITLKKISRGYSGFTLLELLIALFIFTLLSVILMGGLRTVINAWEGTESKADRLRNIQRALLMMSRDIEQIVNRSIVNAAGEKEPAFSGTVRSFTFTHVGVANPDSLQVASAMQHARYFWEKTSLWKETWPVIDQAPQTKSHLRELLENIDVVKFEYLNEHGKFQTEWPQENNAKQAVPCAVKVSFIIRNLGDLSQIYVIAAQENKKTAVSQQSE